MKCRFIIFLIAAFLMAAGNGYAETSKANNTVFFQGFYLKAKEQLDAAVEKITRLEEEIKKNSDTINRAEKIIGIASQRNDHNARQAENTAREALITATGALEKNKEALSQWKLKRIRAENAILLIKNMINDNTGNGQKIRGFVSDHNGKVEIVGGNGNRVYPGEEQAVIVGKGDKIITHDNSFLNMQFLDGRGAARLASNTQIIMSEDSPEKQEILITKGKIYGAIDKVDEYYNKIKNGIKNYHDDLKAIGEYLDDEEIKRRVNRQLHIMLLDIKGTIHPENREYYYEEASNKIRYYRITAVCAVRGTKFTVENREDGSGAITVLDGLVEITPKGEDTLKIEGGYMVNFRDNKFSVPQKTENIDNWWENE